MQIPCKSGIEQCNQLHSRFRRCLFVCWCLCLLLLLLLLLILMLLFLCNALTFCLYLFFCMRNFKFAACTLFLSVSFVCTGIGTRTHASLDVSDVLLKWFKLFEYEFHYHKQNVNFFVQPQNRQTFTFRAFAFCFSRTPISSYRSLLLLLLSFFTIHSVSFSWFWRKVFIMSFCHREHQSACNKSSLRTSNIWEICTLPRV